MSLIMPSRRLFLGGLIAAPAVIAANKLMPVKSFDLLDIPQEEWVLIGKPGTYGPMLNSLAWIPKNRFAYNNREYGESNYSILRTVEVPARTNYKKVHAGTELLKIHPGTIIT